MCHSSEGKQRETPSPLYLRDVEKIRQSSKNLSKHPVSEVSHAHKYKTFDPPE